MTAVFSAALKLAELKTICVLLCNYYYSNRSIDALKTLNIYSIKLEYIQNVSKHLNACLFSYLLIIWQNMQKKTFIKLSKNLAVSLAKKGILIVMLIIKNEELIHDIWLNLIEASKWLKASDTGMKDDAALSKIE